MVGLSYFLHRYPQHQAICLFFQNRVLTQMSLALTPVKITVITTDKWTIALCKIIYCDGCACQIYINRKLLSQRKWGRDRRHPLLRVAQYAREHNINLRYDGRISSAQLQVTSVTTARKLLG
jgi:hypothetical protein